MLPQGDMTVRLMFGKPSGQAKKEKIKALRKVKRLRKPVGSESIFGMDWGREGAMNNAVLRRKEIVWH